MHESVYFILAFFVMILLNIIFEHKKYALTIIITAIICLAFAAKDEFHQTFVNIRIGQILDAIIDFMESIVSIIFYSSYHITYKSGYKKGIKENQKVETN